MACIMRGTDIRISRFPKDEGGRLPPPTPLEVGWQRLEGKEIISPAHGGTKECFSNKLNAVLSTTYGSSVL